MLNQQIRSIAKAVYDVCQFQPYFEEVPESFKIPSTYFPQPIAQPYVDSTTTFTNQYTLMMKVFAATTNGALRIAQDISDDVLSRKLKIPIVNEDGTLSGSNLKIQKIAFSRVDDGVAQVQFTWITHFAFEVINTGMLEEFFLSYVTKI